MMHQNASGLDILNFGAWAYQQTLWTLNILKHDKTLYSITSVNRNPLLIGPADCSQ